MGAALARKVHRCLADKTCPKWVRYSEWCCPQHVAILSNAVPEGWRLAAQVQSGWSCRIQDPERYHAAKARALKVLADVKAARPASVPCP